MARSTQEKELSEDFAGQYRRAQLPVYLELERAVCGCDYGGTSWTTRAEADQMSRLLGLDKSKTLLELGAGSGWPALYLAGQSGCHATLADIPHDGLRIAADRVATEPISGGVSFAVADGAALPFQSAHFDAISHSDVLCCLEPKREVLNECRRAIRHGGKMAFSVIYIAPELSAADHARAVDSGPPYVEAESGYPELLAATGWNVTDQIAASGDYEETGRRYIREVEARADEMIELLGDAEFDEMLARRHRNVDAVAEGIVRRDLFVAQICD
jgi:ubiquinone/menaquinone biosynthesis C-methylase UbiE